MQLAGILQVFSFLVIPALVGRLYMREPVPVMMRGWAIGLVVCLAGVSPSYKLDVPTAPLIVASLSLIFFFSLQSRRHPAPEEQMPSRLSFPKSYWP